MSQWAAQMSIMSAERTEGEIRLEGSSQNASFLQEKGFGEASVLPHWKLEEVSFFQAGRFHPTQIMKLNYFQNQSVLHGPSGVNKFG